MPQGVRRVVRNTSTDINQSLKSKVPRGRIRPWRIIRIILIMLLVIAAVYVILGSTLLRVHGVKVEGTTSGAMAGDIQKSIELQLSQNIFSSNVLSLNTRKIEEETKRQIPLIESIQVRLALPLRLVAAVQLHQAQIRWRSGADNYAVASDGRAFRKSSGQDDQLPLVVDNSNVPLTEGQQVTSDQFVKFVREIDSQLPGLVGGIKQYDVFDTTYEISVLTATGYRIKLDSSRPSKDQIAELSAVIGLVKKQNKKINEYVDVRIAGRSFYK